MIKILFRYRNFLTAILSAVLIILNSLLSPVNVVGQTVNDGNLPTRIWSVKSADEQGNPTATNVLLPDWKQITFSQMPPISKSGSINALSYTQAVGYDLSRTWQAGQTPDQYMKLGDVSQALQPELLSVGAIAQTTGLNLNQVALSTFTLVSQQTLNQLVKAVPLLGQFNVLKVAPIAALLANKTGGMDVSELPIAQVLAQNPQLGQLKLGETDLSRYSVSSIPNLDSTPLQQFTGWQNTFIKDVPGLNAVPLAAMPNPMTELGSSVMRIDMIYGKAEAKRTNTISGSDVQGFSVPCQENCAYIELNDLENQGQVARGRLEGKQWISGKYQEVEGGWGCLKGVNGGKEPTGRLPFGSSFKVVVWESNETTDSVTTALFFRFCSPCGCTPYFIGPVPFFTYRVNSPIFIGTLDERLITDVSMPTQAQPQVMSSSASTSKPVQNNVNVPCSSAKTSSASLQGVNLDALDRAFASDAQSDEFSPYVCADGGKCGRALGKYQDMSYNPYAVKAISSKPSGEAWLSKIRSGGEITKEELFEFYPPADQEAAFNASLRDLIASTSKQTDPKTGKLYFGDSLSDTLSDRLIERVAQKHFGGEYSKVDSGASETYNQLTIYNYGLDVLKRYKSNTNSTLTSTACIPTASSISSSSPASPLLK